MQYEIINLTTFTAEEAYHIRTLRKLKQSLESQERASQHGLGTVKKDELEALKWLFKLLTEISEE